MGPVVCLCGAQFANHSELHKHADREGHFFRCHTAQCGKIFRTLDAVTGHQTSVKHDHVVQVLEAVVGDASQPETATSAEVVKCPFCSKDKKPFKDVDALNQHKKDKHPTVCPSCAQFFKSAEQRFEHQKQVDHCYCAEHDRVFEDPKDLKDHMRGSVHTTGFQCLDCVRDFKTSKGLSDHLSACPAKDKEVTMSQSERAKFVHVAVSEANLRCEECQRSFKNSTALRQHNESVKHKPLANFTCNMCPSKCNQGFTSYSAWFLHVESGNCKSGVTRKTLYAIVHKSDKANLITNASDKLTVPSVSSNRESVRATLAAARVHDLEEDLDALSIADSESSQVLALPEFYDAVSDFASASGIALTPDTSEVSTYGGVNLTPSGTGTLISSSQQPLTPVDSIDGRSEWSHILNHSQRLIATAISVDGASTATITYEDLTQNNGSWPCQICAKRFRSAKRLLQHMRSPAHMPKLFHCPPMEVSESAKPKPQKLFKTLSGLAQHVEAGACNRDVGLLSQLVAGCQSRGRIASAGEKKLVVGDPSSSLV